MRKIEIEGILKAHSDAQSALAMSTTEIDKAYHLGRIDGIHAALAMYRQALKDAPVRRAVKQIGGEVVTI